MYRNDDSNEPLWTVDWYAYVVSVPSGGDHVVRYHSGGWYWQDRPALAFYERGELIRSYEIGDLVTFPFLIDHGDWIAEWSLSDESYTIAVTTETEERYVFDIRTGQVVSRFRPLRYGCIAVVALAVLGGVLLIRAESGGESP